MVFTKLNTPTFNNKKRSILLGIGVFLFSFSVIHIHGITLFFVSVVKKVAIQEACKSISDISQDQEKTTYLSKKITYFFSREFNDRPLSIIIKDMELYSIVDIKDRRFINGALLGLEKRLFYIISIPDQASKHPKKVGLLYRDSYLAFNVTNYVNNKMIIDMEKPEVVCGID